MNTGIWCAVTSGSGASSRHGDPDDTVGPLFDWYFNGDTDLSARASGWTFRVSLTGAPPVW